MLGDTPTVNQRSPVRLVVALHQHARDGLGAAGQDAHLVVDQLDVLDDALVAAEVLAQRLVERVAPGRCPPPPTTAARRSPSTNTFTVASDTVTSLPQRVVALLDHDAEAVDREELAAPRPAAAAPAARRRHPPPRRHSPRPRAPSPRRAALRRADRRCRAGMPSRSSSCIRFDLPAWSDTSTRRRLPTLSGGTCS